MRVEASLQALPDEAAVLAEQRDDVRDGGQRDEVEVLVGHPRVLAVGLQERLGELVRDRGGAQVRAREAADPGCTIGASEGAVGPRAVVVRDDHVHALRTGARDLVDRGDRAVHGHQQVGAALGQPSTVAAARP